MNSEFKFTSDLRVGLVQSMGDDRSVVAAARVSFLGPATVERVDGEMGDRDKGLVNFLMKNKHGTPFEHNAFTFFVEAPIFVFREFHRHRIGWSYNEQSGRYSELPPRFYVPGPDRPLVQEGKPGAYTFVPGEDVQYTIMLDELQLETAEAYRTYQRLLGEGIAKEVARMVLPVNTYSSMYATCNARSLMNFLALRNAPQAMYEIREVARKMETLWSEQMPVTHHSFVHNERVAP